MPSKGMLVWSAATPGLLRLFGLVAIVTGVILGFGVWTQVPSLAGTPAAIWSGLAIAVLGCLVGCVCQVIANIADDVAAVRARVERAS